MKIAFQVTPRSKLPRLTLHGVLIDWVDLMKYSINQRKPCWEFALTSSPTIVAKSSVYRISHRPTPIEARATDCKKTQEFHFSFADTLTWSLKGTKPQRIELKTDSCVSP